MDVYQTEEEQVESIKKWWAENSRTIIFAVAIGLISLFGWQSWQEKKQTHAFEASDIYQQLAKSMKDSKFDEAILLANEINETYADTAYVALAGLQKAKAQIEIADRKGAIESLQKVAATEGNNSIQHVARLRAYRMRIADGDLKNVIADIESLIAEEKGLNPGEFIGQYEALKGDAYRLSGDIEKARFSYIAALSKASLDRQLIQLKLDDLGPLPANLADESTEAVAEIEK